MNRCNKPSMYFLHSTCWLIAHVMTSFAKEIYLKWFYLCIILLNKYSMPCKFQRLECKGKCISNACMYIKISLIVFYLEGDFSSPVPRWDICVRWKYEMLLYVVHAGRVGDLYHKYTTSYFNHNLPDPCEKIKFHLWNKCKHCSYWCWHSPLQSHFNIYTAVWL